jgi:hypothetical protein
MPDKNSYMFNETLRDGTPITLRAARADDGPTIRRAFRNLNRDTIYTLFLAIGQMFLTPSSNGSPARISIVTLPF